MLLQFLLISSLMVQSSSLTQEANPKLLIEVTFTACGQRDCDVTLTRIYSDGRLSVEQSYPEVAKSGRVRKVKASKEKQLEVGEVAELINWVEAPDFQRAGSEYTKVVIDYRDEYLLKTHTSRGEKVIRIANFSRSSEIERSRVPASVIRLLRWVDPYYFDNLPK